WISERCMHILAGTDEPSEPFCRSRQGRRGYTSRGGRFLRLEVAQREFQPAVLGMLVVVHTKRNVNIVPGQKLGRLRPLSKLPAQRVETDGLAPSGGLGLPVRRQSQLHVLVLDHP